MKTWYQTDKDYEIIENRCFRPSHAHIPKDNYFVSAFFLQINRTFLFRQKDCLFSVFRTLFFAEIKKQKTQKVFVFCVLIYACSLSLKADQYQRKTVNALMDTVQRLFGIGSARTIVQCSILDIQS